MPCAHYNCQYESLTTLAELEDTVYGEVNAKMKPLVAWKKCSKPKRKGGLGIINLISQNTALLLKHLDKFYNKKEIPWVKLVWFAHYSDGEIPHATTDKGSFW